MANADQEPGADAGSVDDYVRHRFERAPPPLVPQTSEPSGAASPPDEEYYLKFSSHDFEPRQPLSAFKWAPGESERVSLLPIRHPELWKFRKTMEALHWIPQEVDLTREKKDWATMNPDQQHFVKMQLAFFARIDIEVLDNIGDNFANEVDCMEAKMVYAAQMDQECGHSESYGLQIESILDGGERDRVLNAVKTMPVIADIRKWVLSWFDRALPIGERLVAFAAVEGVLFSASFAALQYLRELNKLGGITAFNEFIVRDEGVHTLFTSTIVRDFLRERPPQVRVEEIFRSLFGVLDEFVQKSLPVRLIGMNDTLMMQYVRYQADCVLVGMGYGRISRVKNPFRFMDKLTLNEVAKTNFFEKRPNEYQNVVEAGASDLAIDDSPVVY